MTPLLSNSESARSTVLTLRPRRWLVRRTDGNYSPSSSTPRCA